MRSSSGLAIMYSYWCTIKDSTKLYLSMQFLFALCCLVFQNEMVLYFDFVMQLC